MTPVEELIDHEEAKKRVEFWLSGPMEGNRPGRYEYVVLARHYLDLLTEHSAREELIEAVEGWAKVRAAFVEEPGSDRAQVLALAEQNVLAALSALPATEPAHQPDPRYDTDRLAWTCQHGRVGLWKPGGKPPWDCVEGLRFSESCVWEPAQPEEEPKP